MKFLLFNLVVAGALVYLFTADRADVQAAADRVYETAGDIKAVARSAVGKGRELLRGDDTASSRPNPPPRVANQPPPRIEPPAAPYAAPAAPPVAPPVDRVAREISRLPVSPEVARRRDEVLGTVPPTPTQAPAPAPTPEIKRGEKLMSPSQRQKELFALAEEMELFYARRTGR
jgi:hypothetical protein